MLQVINNSHAQSIQNLQNYERLSPSYATLYGIDSDTETRPLFPEIIENHQNPTACHKVVSNYTAFPRPGSTACLKPLSLSYYTHHHKPKRSESQPLNGFRGHRLKKPEIWRNGKPSSYNEIKTENCRLESSDPSRVDVINTDEEIGPFQQVPNFAWRCISSETHGFTGNTQSKNEQLTNDKTNPKKTISASLESIHPFPLPRYESLRTQLKTGHCHDIKNNDQQHTILENNEVDQVAIANSSFQNALPLIAQMSLDETGACTEKDSKIIKIRLKSILKKRKKAHMPCRRSFEKNVRFSVKLNIRTYSDEMNSHVNDSEEELVDKKLPISSAKKKGNRKSRMCKNLFGRNKIRFDGMSPHERFAEGKHICIRKYTGTVEFPKRHN